jgi:hypothetical protein
MLERQELFILITVVTAIAVGSCLLFLLGFKAFIAGILMVISAAVTYQYPHTSLYLFLIYLPLAGTITYSIPGVYQPVGEKIVFSSIYPVLQLVKDIFYFPALMAVVVGRKSLQEMLPKIKPFIWVLSCFVAVCLLNFVFVNIPLQFEVIKGSPFLMGIMGLKIWLGYIPLMVCTFYLVRNRKDLFFLTRLQIILIIVCCSLCLVQYLLLIRGICQGSVGLPEPIYHRTSLQARCFVGGSLLYNPDLNLIRLPGTFVSPWQWGWFLVSSIFFTVAGSQSDPQKIWRSLSWAATILVLIGSVISGQRIALLIVPFFFLLLIVLTEKKGKKLAIKLGLISLIGVISLSLPIVQQRIQSFIARWHYSPPSEFIWKQWQFALSNQQGILGQGLGTTASAARKLGPIKLIEVFHSQLIYEMGPLGLITFLALVSILVYLGFKNYRFLKDRYLKNLSICLWVFVLFISYNIYYYPLNVDPVAVYYWFVAGLLLKLPQLEADDPLETETKEKLAISS